MESKTGLLAFSSLIPRMVQLNYQKSPFKYLQHLSQVLLIGSSTLQLRIPYNELDPDVRAQTAGTLSQSVNVRCGVSIVLSTDGSRSLQVQAKV